MLAIYLRNCSLLIIILMSFSCRQNKDNERLIVLNDFILNKINLEQALYEKSSNDTIEIKLNKFIKSWVAIKNDSSSYKSFIDNMSCENDNKTYQLCYTDKLNSNIPSFYIAKCDQRKKLLLYFLSLNKESLVKDIYPPVPASL